VKQAITLSIMIISVVATAGTHLDGENTTVFALPQINHFKSEKIMISIDIQNTTTNQFEIWFCADAEAARKNRDFLIGFDDGFLIHGTRNATTIQTMSETLASGNFNANLSYRTRAFHPTPIIKLSVNGRYLNDTVLCDFSNASPLYWQSLKLVSRGKDALTPIIQTKRIKIGMYIKITLNKNVFSDSIRRVGT
jgi:hypothetical protein